MKYLSLFIALYFFFYFFPQLILTFHSDFEICEFSTKKREYSILNRCIYNIKRRKLSILKKFFKSLLVNTLW